MKNNAQKHSFCAFFVQSWEQLRGIYEFVHMINLVLGVGVR